MTPPPSLKGKMRLFAKLNTESGRKYLGKLLWDDFSRWMLRRIKMLGSDMKAYIGHEVFKIWAAQRAWSAFVSDTIPDYGINSWTVVPYSTVHFLGSRYDDKDYRYYAQKTGTHNIAAYLRMSPHIATPISNLLDLELAVFKNGSYYKPLDFEHGNIGSAYTFCLNGSCEVFMLCGEYIDIRFRHQSPDSIRAQNTINPRGYFDGHYSGENVEMINPTVQSA
jgi:hypothetical protein